MCRDLLNSGGRKNNFPTQSEQDTCHDRHYRQLVDFVVRIQVLLGYRFRRDAEFMSRRRYGVLV